MWILSISCLAMLIAIAALVISVRIRREALLAERSAREAAARTTIDPFDKVIVLAHRAALATDTAMLALQKSATPEKCEAALSAWHGETRQIEREAERLMREPGQSIEVIGKCLCLDVALSPLPRRDGGDHLFKSISDLGTRKHMIGELIVNVAVQGDARQMLLDHMRKVSVSPALH